MIVARPVTQATRAARRAAFTLMEVMVVVTILVILASVAGVAVFKYLDDANESAAKLKITNIEMAASSYKLKHGTFPPSLQDLCAVEQGATAAYLEEKDILDPWGNLFQYDPSHLSPTGKPHIFTVSPGGAQLGNF
jgi:general secretion pathway protein G